MALLPYRNLGELGTIPDVTPLGLAPSGWSASKNMRFNDGALSRGPHFRKIGTASLGTPSFVFGSPVAQTGGSEFLIGLQDGRVQRWTARDRNASPGVEMDLTPLEWSPSVYTNEPITAAEVGGIIYLNRPDRPLWYLEKTGDAFAPAPGWNEQWRAKAIRTLGNQVIAIGVQRNGIYFPTMVKFSDIAPFASPNVEWVSDPENSAGENLLGNLAEKLVDGASLRGRMFLYADHGVISMTPRPDTLVFDFQPFLSDKGVISQNCIAEVSNVHYVFGTESLWAHDRSSEVFTSDGTITRDVYDYLVRDAAYRFFTYYNRDRQEVMFCHVSTHPSCKFKVGKGNVPADLDPYPGCNRSATFNIRSKTWSFDDLPYVVGAATVAPTTGVRWEELMTTKWEDMMDVTWLDMLDRNPRLPLFVSPIRTLNADPTEPPKATDDTFTMRRTTRRS